MKAQIKYEFSKQFNSDPILIGAVHKVRHARGGGGGPRRCDSLWQGGGGPRACDVTL